LYLDRPSNYDDIWGRPTTKDPALRIVHDYYSGPNYNISSNYKIYYDNGLNATKYISGNTITLTNTNIGSFFISANSLEGMVPFYLNVNPSNIILYSRINNSSAYSAKLSPSLSVKLTTNGIDSITFGNSLTLSNVPASEYGSLPQNNTLKALVGAPITILMGGRKKTRKTRKSKTKKLKRKN
jgi:hypothetical protein